MLGYKYDMQKDASLDIQKKPIDVLKIKTEIINQESDLDYSFILNLQKKFVKALKNLVKGDKEEMK